MRSFLAVVLAVFIFLLAVCAANEQTEREAINSLASAMEEAPFY